MKIVNIMIARGLGGIEQAFLDYNNALLSQCFEVLAITDKRAKINEVFKGKSISTPLSVLDSGVHQYVSYCPLSISAIY